MNSQSIPGISVIIPTYNGKDRIKPTLRHLVLQHGANAIHWEVVLVDNASVDGTAEYAMQLWNEWKVKTPLRCVHESQQGLSSARMKGVASAKYDAISFVDDDNWVAPDWIRSCWNLIQENPEVGAFGAQSEPVFESPPAQWLNASIWKCWAIGSCGPLGDISNMLDVCIPWGAGLLVRRNAILTLVNNGFQFSLEDRSKKRLTSGGDSELVLAVRLSGWRIFNASTLNLKHYIPSDKITSRYARRLLVRIGEALLFISVYRAVLHNDQRSFRYFSKLIFAILKLVKPGFSLVNVLFRNRIDSGVRARLFLLGYITGLILHGGKVAALRKSLENASWRASLPLKHGGQIGEIC